MKTILLLLLSCLPLCAATTYTVLSDNTNRTITGGTTNLSFLNATNQVFTGTNSFSSVVTATNTANTFAGNSATLTSLYTYGNVGIGTTSPAQLLHIYGTVPLLKIQANTGAGSSGIDFASSATSWGGLLMNPNSGEFKIGNTAGSGFYTTLVVDNSEKVRVLTSGNVGIGTTTPASRLQVVGTGLTIGTAGTAVTNYASATATLNFASILAAGYEDLTITVTGAVVNDTVTLGLPATVLAGALFNSWVSAANTVTVRCNNAGSIAVDPASATYRVGVTSH